jgi:hypothetical protein
LPLAATYVIDQQRKNCVHVLDAEYRNRAEADDILAALGFKNNIKQIYNFVQIR